MTSSLPMTPARWVALALGLPVVLAIIGWTSFTFIAAADASGNVTLVFTKVPRRVDVTDESGDIALVLPRGPVSYQVRLGSSSGTTSVAVNRGASSPYVIIANDVSGNISISY